MGSRRGVAIAVALLVALAVSFFVGPLASGDPDGLQRVARDHDLDRTAEDHALDDLPTAGYAVRGIDDERLSAGVAGALGVAITFVVAGGVLLAVRRKAVATPAPDRG